MDQNGSPNMPVSQSYPSPSAVAVGDGAGPFFAHQQRLSPPDELRLAAQMSRAHPAMMTAGHNGADAGMALHHHQHQAAHAHHHHHHGANLRAPGSPVNHFPAGGADPNHDPAFADPNAPRKRSKVSRACDECRRKKIRCDATSETGFDQCSSCKRVGTRCQFSRVPMKRGPSKGYIKELADRLNTLENSMIPAQNADMSYQNLDAASGSPRQADAYSPPSAGATDPSASSRKRTYSAVDDPVNAPYGQTNPRRPSIGAWSSHETPRHLPHPASGLPTAQTPQSAQSVSDFNQSLAHRVQSSPNGVPAPFWKPTASDMGGRAEGNGMSAEMTDLNYVDAQFEWNDAIVDCYYEHVHQVFPLLPHSKAYLRARLSRCSANVREAFLGALGVLAASIQSNAGTRPSSAHGNGLVKKASDLLSAVQFEGSAARSMSTNLVYLQTMILMALEGDKRGPSGGRGDVGPPRAVWLGAAVGLAYDLRLHSVRSRDQYATGDMDSDERLGRRGWWVLVMLDRWHAVSTSRPLLIPDTTVVSIPEDRALLGDIAFHLSRLSCVLGHVAEVFVTADDAMASPPSGRPLMGKLLLGELERFREGVDPVMHSLPVVQLAYWHVKLLIQRVVPQPETYDLLVPAQHIATVLHSLGSGTGVTALRHHFAALAVLTLSGLAEVVETKEGACSAMHLLRQAIEQRRGFAPDEVPSAWDVVIRDMILKKQDTSSAPEAPMSENQGGLQHLADLAVNERGQEGTMQGKHDSAGQGSPTAVGNSSGAANAKTNKATENQGLAIPAGFDATNVMKYGYLNVLAQAVNDGPVAVTSSVTPNNNPVTNTAGGNTNAANVNATANNGGNTGGNNNNVNTSVASNRA